MGLFDDLFDPDDLLDANASSSVSGPGAKPDAPPPPAGVLPSPAPQSALELAAKIAQLIELGADEDSIIEMYAAFERVYPHAALPGDSQPRMARLLEDRRHRLLAIEAWRKVAGDDRDAERAAEGSVGLIRLFSQSLSTYGEAMSAIRRLHSLAPEGPWLEQTFPIGEKIRRTLDSIYPLTASGETGTAPEGPCAIVAQTCDKIPIPIVGALLASRLGLRLMDVNVALARMPGILARDLPAGEARSLAHLIQEQGKTPVVVLEESRCEPAPPAETVIEVNAVDGGMFQLETRESGVFDLDPAQIDHAFYGLTRTRKTRSRHVPSAAAAMGRWTIHQSSSGSRTSHEILVGGVCDLYFFNPPRRLRLVESETSLWSLQRFRPDAPRATFASHLKRILGGARNAPLNFTLDALFSDRNLDAIAFETMTHFENRAEHLYLLAKNGVAGE